MSSGYLYSVNSATQAIAIGGTLNMGTAIRRFGCVKGTSTPYANVNGTNTVLASCGRCPAYFDFETSIILTPTDVGTVTITAFQDGTAIPGAVATATVAAAATTVTLPLSFGVRLNAGTTTSNITYVLTGADSSITNIAQTVTKE